MIRTITLACIFSCTSFLNAQWCFSGPTSLPSTELPFGVSSADFNYDSFPDLAVGRYFVSEFAIYLNDSSGGFPTETIYTATGGVWVRHAIPGDFNSDSITDLLVIGRGNGNIAIFNGDGTGGFTQATSETGGTDLFAGVTGYFDGDAALDWAVIDVTNNNLLVYLGNGNNGHWYDITYNLGGRGPGGIKAADINGDSITDLVVACRGDINGLNKGIDIFLGNGNGTFTGTYEALSYPASDIELIDLNSDGARDLVIAGGGPLKVVNGNNSGTFNFPGTNQTNYVSGTYLYSDDIDEDGIQDILATGYGVTLFRGDGQGGLDSVFSYSFGIHKMAAIADFDNDSRKDVASVETFANTTDIFLNCFDVGISTVTLSLHNIIVFPNPSTGQTTITSDAFSESTENFVRIFDMDGRLILEQSYTSLSDKTVTIDISSLQNGVYVVVAGNDTGLARSEFVKIEPE